MWTTAERRTTISLSPPSIPRLRLEPTCSPGTLLDGGWWPRSADPVAELPGLILAIDHRNGRITGVMLGAADWEGRPRRLRVDDPSDYSLAADRVVRLSWFDTMPAGLLTATCAGGSRIDLLIIPAHTSPAAAEAAMELAAHPDNCLHTPDLLRAIAAPPVGQDDPKPRLRQRTSGNSVRTADQRSTRGSAQSRRDGTVAQGE
jgi:hypothetical protein